MNPEQTRGVVRGVRCDGDMRVYDPHANWIGASRMKHGYGGRTLVTGPAFLYFAVTGGRGASAAATAALQSFKLFCRARVV